MVFKKKTLRSPRIAVIGAGMTGLLMAIKLKEAGYTQVHVFEKASTLGGTWRENTYPGVACDIPSHMYTYSFAPNPEWSNLFAEGSEIQNYLLNVARRFNVLSSIRFNEGVNSCVLEGHTWRVGTTLGKEEEVDFVINCTGILHHPAFPDIEGIDQYQGVMFHTAQWNHHFDPRGKRVGVIGTGSTAAQLIPELAKQVEHLTVFQRTPQWIFPLPNKQFAEGTKAFLRKSQVGLRAIRDFETWNISNLLTKAVIGHPVQKAILTAACKANLRLSVKDAALRKKLTPNYTVGCKRIVVNATFYPAIQQPHVHLETLGIKRFTPEGIETSDGQEHKLDAVVLSTGFQAKNYMRPMNLIGREGLDINEAWKDRVNTYRSVCMPGFPNNFLMLGPHSPIGNFSVIAISEVQAAYVLKLIKGWTEGRYNTIEPKQSAVDSFSQYVKAGLKNTVWKGGCQSWYLDKDGDPILWPYTWQQWVKEMKTPIHKDFVLG